MTNTVVHTAMLAQAHHIGSVVVPLASCCVPRETGQRASDAAPYIGVKRPIYSSGSFSGMNRLPAKLSKTIDVDAIATVLLPGTAIAQAIP